MNFTIARIRHLHEILLRPFWTWGFVGLVGILGGAAFIRDEFFPEDVSKKFKLLELLPHWSVSTWGFAFAVAFFMVVFEGSYRAYRKAMASVASLQETLDRIAEDRPFDFDNSAWNVSGSDFHKSPPTWSISRIEIIFSNSSDRLIAYKFKELFLEHNGIKIDIHIDPDAAQYIHANKAMGYGFDVHNMIVRQFPAKISIGYRIEYDNQPSVRVRGTSRIIEHTFRSFSPMSYSSKITHQNEY